MEKLHEEKEIVKLEKKINDESLVSTLRGMSVSELEYKLLEMAKHKEEIVTTKGIDEELSSAVETVKELSAPYREQLGANKLKSRFIHLLIKEKA